MRSVTRPPGRIVKASDLQRAFQECLPKSRDEAGHEVPFPIRVVEFFESPSRRGYGPQGLGHTLDETLLYAAMRQLYRDDELGQRVRALAASWPACAGLHPEIPARFMVDHVTIGGHDVGPCREWMSWVVGLARDAGCPSLEAMLSQFEAAVGLRPGRVRRTRLRAVAPPGPRRPTGVRDRPAMGLLARRAYQVGGLGALRARIAAAAQPAQGMEPVAVRKDPPSADRGGWPGLALELEREIGEWEDGREPDRREITHPAWEEWQRSGLRRQGRDRVLVEDSRRRAAPDLGQSYRKVAAGIDRALRASLPPGWDGH